MGYTHYWESKEPNFNEEKFVEFSQDCEKILALAKQDGIKLAGGLGEAEPITNEKIVWFNGVGDESHESFSMNQNEGDFDFCKTNNKPYDIVVTACLVMLKHHFRESVKVSSDGTPLEWLPGLNLARAATGKTLANPIH